MANSSNDAVPEYKVLSPFQVLVGQIGNQLTSNDVKVIKTSLLDTRVYTKADLEDIDSKVTDPGVELISRLRKRHYISPNNLELLEDLLKITNNFRLLEKVQILKKSETELYNAPVKQMERELPASMPVDLFLVLPCKKEHLSKALIDKLKEEIRNSMRQKGFNIRSLPFICSGENEADRETTVARFQFPETDPKTQPISQALISSAMNKEDWLRKNEIMVLQVDGKSSINIAENVGLKFSSPDHEEFILAKKPRLEEHQKNVVDVILVVEMPTTVTPNRCKTMLDECQSAADYLSCDDQIASEVDINLAIVKYGNHQASAEPIALIAQDFCKEFNVKSKLKEEGQCGGGGNSGMADALAKVVKLVEDGKTRPAASKVCIMISFLSKGEKGVEHYQCNHGNDIIKLSNTLAEYEIPLYILGVHGNTQRKGSKEERNVYFEECFLAGVCHIGGGRYLRILKNEVKQVNKMISNVVRNDLSIENHGTITGEAVKDALNNHYGDVNEIQLAKDVIQDARIKPLHFEKLLQNGQSLDPVKQVVKRVAFADDLSDAIQAMELFQNREDAEKNSVSRCVVLERGIPNFDEMCSGNIKENSQDDQAKLRALSLKLAQSGDSLDDVEMPLASQKSSHAEVLKSFHETPDTSTKERAKESIDLEMSTRIVRRHLHRMAYYRKKLN